MIRLGRISYVNMAPIFFGLTAEVEELVRVIQAAGRVPVQRDTLYNEIRRWE